MKNQYFGDVGDYGKYGLLRFFREKDISVAINWYLTADDDGNDGRHISYLEKDQYFKYDPKLYVFLKENVITQKKRFVGLIEKSDLIDGAIYYNALIADPKEYVKKEREKIRNQWHEEGLRFCAGKELIFLDPDNGFRTGIPQKIKDQVKYCYANEVFDYYNSGSNVFYYSHKGHRTDKQWHDVKQSMCMATPDAYMFGLTFHRGTQRSYIFAIHPNDADHYKVLFDTFLHTNWKDLFTVEDMG